ncbi:MAG: radical SAM protein [Gemmatimonadetes bacterium]|nr:radical SAM protein [Gemmatimonadota bacterium]
MIANAAQRHPGTPHHRVNYDDAPLVLTWEITQACDLKCIHCRAEACPDRDPGELSTEAAAAVIDRIAAFAPNPPILVFSGGDPLKRPDLFELIGHATAAGLHTAVTPASSPLLTRPVIERLRDSRVSRMALSLDGATAAAHDGFRGEVGSFDTILRGARDAREFGLAVQINSTVTKTTAADLPAIADLVEGLGAVMWEVFFLVPVGRGAGLEALRADETEAVLEWLYARGRHAPFRVITVEAPHYRRVAHRAERRNGNRGVRVGSTGDGKGFLFISHLGEIFPSGFLPVSAGNVRSDDVVDVYRNSPLFRTLRDPDALKGKCGVCEYRAICGGARARAFAVTGDYREADPFCAYVSRRYRRMVEAGDAEPVEAYFARRDQRSRVLPVVPAVPALRS